MTGVIVLLAALVATVLLGALSKRTTGRMRTRSVDPAARSVLVALGETPAGHQATLVQFSSAFCQPCVATRRVLEEVVGMVQGVRHLEVDAESRLDVVRELGIMRTPTVLVLDSYGREVMRASGLPRKVDVIAALGPLLPTRIDTSTPGPLG